MEMESVIIGPPPTVEVYRLTYVGDQLVNREYLYTDEYDVPPPPEEEKPVETPAMFEPASAPAAEPAQEAKPSAAETKPTPEPAPPAPPAQPAPGPASPSAAPALNTQAPKR